MGEPPHHRLRYVGSIASLFELIALFEEAGLPTELRPGPSPDVTIAVATHHLEDGPDRMASALDAWGSGRVGESATLLPRWYV